MKFTVIDRGDLTSQQLSQSFVEKAIQKGLIWDEKNPDMVISIGGDGTMLRAFHFYKEQTDQIAFLGIHTGNLGFYTDWHPEDLQEILECMTSSQPKWITYPLLNVEIETAAQKQTFLLLNEFTLKSAEATVVAEIYIDGLPFETICGDGIVISTPTGSTGYNKSAGGAVVHPSLEVLQLTEIATINNLVYRTLNSPLILPKNHYCDIYPKKLEHQFVITIDHQIIKLANIRSIHCSISEKKISFARYRSFPFWKRVRQTFIKPSENKNLNI